ncbi:sigma-70 family RNA polymerase sigma factor [Pseudonocardia oroxyli]|uniref:sigma-70 family RNA polymerase sigma factor n=1 Tax=Pseudonocardia oroxyli TaxID=366584 RepID=UPI000B85F597
MRDLLVADAVDRAEEAAARASAREVDAGLAARVRAGDDGALGALYDRHGRAAWSLARRICIDEQLAEDVVQEAFLSFWRDPTRFDPARGAFATWLLTVVHHKAVDTVRKESTIRRRTVSSDAGDDLPLPAEAGADSQALGAVVAGQVRVALHRLPAEQRQALALAYFGGYTQREVAALTGVPLGTVKSRMFTGLARLRAVLGSTTGYEGAAG